MRMKLASRPPGRLLFPSYRTGRECMADPRTILADAAERAGWKPEEITSKMFRHTYCAARLQTLDRGAPVSVYTVGKELGHGGDALVKRVYGHLGEVRHRAEVVEYRVEQHAAKLGDRLAKVAASERQARPAAKRVTHSGARSSVGQSIGLLSRGSEVRILPGALPVRQLPPHPRSARHRPPCLRSRRSSGRSSVDAPASPPA